MRQWIIIGVIAVVLIGSYLWNRNRQTQPEGETLPPVEDVIVREDGTVVKKVGETEQVLSAEEAEAQKKEIAEKVAGATSVNLQPTEGATATGTTERVYRDNKYYQKVTVQNVLPAQKGYYYEAWLQKEDGTNLSIGRLNVMDSTGEVLYSSSQDKSDYTKLVVTYQAEDGSGEMGEPVLSANLTDTGSAPGESPAATASPVPAL